VVSAGHGKEGKGKGGVVRGAVGKGGGPSADLQRKKS